MELHDCSSKGLIGYFLLRLFSLIVQICYILGCNIEKPVVKEEMEPDVSGTAAELDQMSL